MNKTINKGRWFPVREVCLQWEGMERRERVRKGNREVEFHKRDLAAQTDKKWRREESVQKHSGKDGEIE